MSVRLSVAELLWPCLIVCLGASGCLRGGLGGGWEGLALTSGCHPQVPLKVSLSAGRSWGHLAPLQEAPARDPTTVLPSLQATAQPTPAPERLPPCTHFSPSFGL